MLSRLLVSRLTRVLGTGLVALLLAPGFAAAQTDQGGGAAFKPEELEQIAAPIALYPDPLVAQILMASTYPLEVVQAARFAKANASLKGAQLDDALKKEPWDDSVKSLVAFPQVLTMMNEKLDWTQNLGDAFLGQQKELMDSVQRLRAKAEAAGNLKSNAEQIVKVEPAPAPPAPAPQTVVVQQAPAQIITIQPANPQVVYVPTYNPTVVYGAWPYPAYPPYSYYPPGYVAGTALLSFGLGMAVGGALWGNCNWGGGDVNVNTSNYNSYSHNVNNADIANKRVEHYQGDRGQGNRGQGDRGSGKWQHDPEHRKGAQYRDASTQQRFNKAGGGNVQSREAFRGRAAEGRQEMARGGGQQGTLGGGRASQSPAMGGGQAGQLGGGGQFGGQGARAPGAFEGVGQGRATSMDSAQGRASRESFGASNAGRGGGFQSAGGQRGSSGGGRVQSGSGQRGGSGGGGGGGGGSRGGGGGGGSRGGGRR
jgi:Protein of unknown function (DUF3300)